MIPIHHPMVSFDGIPRFTRRTYRKGRASSNPAVLATLFQCGCSLEFCRTNKRITLVPCPPYGPYISINAFALHMGSCLLLAEIHDLCLLS